MIENWILAIIWIAVAIKCCWGIMGSGIMGSVLLIFFQIK